MGEQDRSRNQVRANERAAAAIASACSTTSPVRVLHAGRGRGEGSLNPGRSHHPNRPGLHAFSSPFRRFRAVRARVRSYFAVARPACAEAPTLWQLLPRITRARLLLWFFFCFFGFVSNRSRTGLARSIMGTLLTAFVSETASWWWWWVWVGGPVEY